ncbi:hypothetical protein CW304_12950 [Bacillus sp. UFRGS-B20]|nr:hypothetical protein CW304_12950 [Bacillus sp. UFRGS-B20]
MNLFTYFLHSKPIFLWINVFSRFFISKLFSAFYNSICVVDKFIPQGIDFLWINFYIQLL